MTLTPGTPEWARVVSASKVAPILGLSPWDSPRAMWHKMRGDIPWDEETRAMRRGNMLENAVLDWWLADNPEWAEVRRQPVYTLPGEDWCLATPDMLVQHRETGEDMLVDAKTAGRDSDWGAEPPAYYIASSMFQLAMAPHVQRVCLATLFGSPFDLRDYYVTRDDELINGILSRCLTFHASLTSDTPPDLDDTVATYEAIKALHPDIDADLDVDVDTETSSEYVTASLALKEAEARDRAARTALLEQMGRARYAHCDGQKVARRQPNRHGVSLVRVAQHITLPEPVKDAS